MKHIWVKQEEVKKKIKLPSLWWSVAVLFLILNIAAGAYYWYMLMEVKRVEAVLEEKTDLLLQKKREYSQVQQDDGYKRYQAAKLVKKSSDMMNWLENTQYLISLIDKLYVIDVEDNTLELSWLAINQSRIELGWRVQAIRSIYREGGVIDTFKSLEFINNLNIPWYNAWEEWIWFSLDATILQYNE